MTVRIVTDSSAYLQPGVAEELGIVVLPFHVQIGARGYLDGIDLDEKMFNHLVYEQGKPSSTSPPTVQEFHRAYEQLNARTSQIISIHISGTLSETCNRAEEAAGLLLGRCQIEVIDSKSVSVGLGILVEAAARAAAQGKTMDQVVRLVRGMVPQIYVVFFSDTLHYLEEGGRIGHAQALLGTILGIKPFLTLEEGEVTPIEKVRTREEALEKLLEFVMEFDAIKKLAIVKGASEPDEETELIIERLNAAFPGIEIPVLSYGPVLASHIGMDTMGMIVYETYDV
jgi:DegV family protein with EDD domain